MFDENGLFLSNYKGGVTNIPVSVLSSSENTDGLHYLLSI